MIKAIETVFNGYKFRSRLEARWAVFFDVLGVKWEYEKEGFVLDGIPYLPDFWIDTWQSWVEIKPKVRESQSEGHDRCIDLSKLILSQCLLISGNPWPWEYSVIVCKEGFTVYVGQFAELEYPSGVIKTGITETEGSYCVLGKQNGFLMKDAFASARSAHFEHGEKPR